MYDLYSTEAFEKAYTYFGNDLGAVWTKDSTVFRVWAPTAEAVTVNLYRSGNENADDLISQLQMEQDVCGTWTARHSGDLSGVYYTYLVLVDETIQEACDPYAVAAGINGKRAMVLNRAATNPAGWENDKNPNAHLTLTDSVIYELHIRDLSMHRSANIRHKGKYLGLTETGVTTKEGHPVGLDHIKSLGITHLHLLPVFDFGSVDEGASLAQYNWGYDPLNYNVPEGSYATDPADGAVRVAEMKQMVKALHDNGISVIMDVVYNHVFKKETYCFNRIVPGYFSRQSASGVFSNGSCCGNDTASERAMVRKYIVDSVKYWAEEYHIDGFRFDLVGLIDLDTVRCVMDAVHETRPDVIFYGEGWSMNTQPTKPGIQLTTQANSARIPGFAFFNDTVRDLLRGSVFDSSGIGYVSGGYCSKDTLEACFMGIPSWSASPSQTVNYVSCHDNNTLFDRICLAAPEALRETQVAMNNLAAAFCILSQGIPFFQAGEELLRTKPGKHGGFDHNSYRSPDKVNSLKWDTLDDPLYRMTRDYYRGLIALRKAHPGFRLATREQVWNQVHPIPCENPHTVAFGITEAQELIFVAFNADTKPVSLPLPPGKWHVHVRDNYAGAAPIATEEGSITVSPISAVVLTRKKITDVVAALVWEKDKFLICQRPANKARGMLWEFVGGKVEPGESKQQALVRECAEELAVNISVGSQFMEVLHEYPDIYIRLTLFHSTIPEGFPQALEHNAIRWIHPSQIDQFDFCPADADILAEIKRIYGNKKPL